MKRIGFLIMMLICTCVQIHAQININATTTIVTDSSRNLLTSLKSKLQNVINNNSTDKIFWAVFGDSMAGTKTKFLLPHFAQMIGQTGAVGTGNYNGVTNNGGGVVGSEQNYNVYPFSYTTIQQGNFLEVGYAGVNANANTYKVYYINNGARITIKLDGVDVSGYSSFQTTNNNTVGVISITTTLAAHQFQIFASVGTVKVVSVGLWDSTKSGVIPIYINEGGNDMSSWINSPSDLAINNLFTILVDLNPNVFSYEMKEDITNLQGRISKLFGKIQQVIPNTEVLIFLTTPIQNDEFQTQKKQNIILSNEAKIRGYSIFDCFQKVKSYSALMSLNWQGDGIHPHEQCHKYLADEFLKDFNLYSLFGATGKKSYSEQVNAIDVNLYNIGGIKADTQYGYDIKLRSKRWIQLTDLAGTEKLRFDLGGDYSDGSQTLLPFMVQFGNNNARIRADGPSLLKVVNSTNTNQLANLQLAELYPTSIGTQGNNLPILNGSGGEIIRFFNNNSVAMSDNSVSTVIPSSLFSLSSTSKGFLPPRMSTINILSITSPAIGLTVYNTDLGCICFFDGTVWRKVSHSTM